MAEQNTNTREDINSGHTDQLELTEEEARSIVAERQDPAFYWNGVEPGLMVTDSHLRFIGIADTSLQLTPEQTSRGVFVPYATLQEIATEKPGGLPAVMKLVDNQLRNNANIVAQAELELLDLPQQDVTLTDTLKTTIAGYYPALIKLRQDTLHMEDIITAQNNPAISEQFNDTKASYWDNLIPVIAQIEALLPGITEYNAIDFMAERDLKNKQELRNIFGTLYSRTSHLSYESISQAWQALARAPEGNAEANRMLLIDEADYLSILPCIAGCNRMATPECVVVTVPDSDREDKRYVIISIDTILGALDRYLSTILTNGSPDINQARNAATQYLQRVCNTVDKCFRTFESSMQMTISYLNDLRSNQTQDQSEDIQRLETRLRDMETNQHIYTQGRSALNTLVAEAERRHGI